MWMAAPRPALCALAGVAALSLLPAALADGDHGGMDMSHKDPKPSEGSFPPNYFGLPEHQGVLYAHIALMVVGWVVLLPVAVMLSLARSRYTVVTQLAFTLTNGGGLLFGLWYNGSTPDLYPNNAHHKLGWIVTWVALAQLVVGILGRLAGAFRPAITSRSAGAEHRAFMPVSTEAMAEHRRGPETRRHARDADAAETSATVGPYRLSNDSGQGTERNTASLRSSTTLSLSARGSPTMDVEAALPLRGAGGHHKETDDSDEEDELDAFHEEFLGGSGESGLSRHVGAGRGGRALQMARQVAGMISSPRAWIVLVFGYDAIDRVILILGFITICTGVITMGRFFEGSEVFSGLAHWIKGGIFFWLGILTLGRWCGAWAELGWAWNIRPRAAAGGKQPWRPSAEWVESFLIFFYGSTNIFLEHLQGWGGAWTSQDLEHISITVLFIGGGLAGLLVESVAIRDLLNAAMTETTASHAREHASSPPRHDDLDGEHHRQEEEEMRERQQTPRQYAVSLNPIPALVIVLLGVMMSSHKQSTMTSTMVHKQWGQLLIGGGFARAFSYALMWLNPPRSSLPSRPPTELLAAFGLMAGGIIFMASSGDTIVGMINQELDAMFMYTVTMGLVGLAMAWTVALMALKGWAVRKEAARRRFSPSYRPL